MPFRARANPAKVLARRNDPLTTRKLHIGHPSISLVRSTPTGLPSKIQQSRNASSGSLFAPLADFFSRKNPVASSSKPIGKPAFLNALSDGRPDDLLQPYNAIVQSLSTPSSEYLTYNELTSAINLLAASPSRKSLDLLQRVYADFTPTFGHELRPRHHRSLFAALTECGMVQQALDFGRSFDNHPDQIFISRDWKALLKLAVQWRTCVDEIEIILRENGWLDSQVMTLLLRNLRHNMSLETSVKLEGYLKDLEEMEREHGWVLNERGCAELIRVYIALKDIDNAKKIASAYQYPGNEEARNPTTTNNMWHALVDLSIAENEKVKEVLETMKAAGFKPPHWALSHLALQNLDIRTKESAIDTSEILKTLEETTRDLSGEAEAVIWSDTIVHFLKESDPLTLYDELRQRDISVTSNLAKALIKFLCGSEPPQSTKAMEVYNDLLSSADRHPEDKIFKPSPSIYHSLLLSCARSTSPAESTATAIKLVTDMRHRGIHFTSSTLTSLIILLMRSAADHTAAFNIYAHFYALGGQTLDEKGYTAILTTFLGLQWQASPFAPLSLFMEILRDMRRAGYNPGPNILASLLHRYAAQPNFGLESSGDGRYRQGASSESALSAIREVHTLMKIDPMIEVDIALLNSLMDAYSKVGAYGDAFEVWDELVERRPREPKESVESDYGPSVNIMLDTCGHSNSLLRARKAWNWARRWRLAQSRANWEAWIECLARVGEIREATKVLTEEMGLEGNPDPSKETVKIVLKFSWRDEYSAGWVREQVQERYPEWWDDLKKFARVKDSS